MATADDIDGQYFIYEARLASFHGPQPVSKRRASNASSRAPKALSWPHKSPTAVSVSLFKKERYLLASDTSKLAKAGFYFNPRPSNPDNVCCFLCHKELDGWEQDDDPLQEHLKHSSGCGWAICAAIEAELGDAAKEDPRQSHLLESRKATFDNRWPYESKKGWKCKTKQLAEAGWKYTPTLDSDDHTTCVYCQLALDGWEPSDKPMDEHQRRSPNCPFFALISQNPAPKKATRGKAARGSKASRASIQSIATVESDTRSVSADHDDSVMTTTSIMTTASKKTAKGKKATTAAKGRKTRAKKEETVEIHEDVDIDNVQLVEASPAKSSRGTKRGSDAMEDSVLTNAEAPAPKKRATRNRASNNVDDTSVLTVNSQADVDMIDPPQPLQAAPGRKKGGRTASKTTRKASNASIASMASTASLRAKIPSDDDLERQLEADLDRPLSDDEDILGDSDSERKKAQSAPKTKGKRVTSRKVVPPVASQEPDDFAMFDPAPKAMDEAAVDAELKSLEAEMQPELPAEEIQVPKKGRKPGPRKASKQVKKGKAAAKSEPEQPQEPVSQPAEPVQQEEEHDISIASTGTVVKGAAEAPAPAPVKRGRGRPPKKSVDSQIATEDTKPAQEVVKQQQEVEDEVEEATVIRQSFSASRQSPGKVVAKSPETTPRTTMSQPSQIQNKALPAPPATPRAYHTSHAPSAKQATVSPSPSLQSSDAENQPPSSKPALSAARPRAALEPVATTPVRTRSPTKRANVIGGLQSNMPWAAVDLELVFSRDNKENGGVVESFLKKGGNLSTPEKQMTVEEWIYHNAGQAEQGLKHECETMVSAFEREGSRAMRVLEELVVD